MKRCFKKEGMYLLTAFILFANMNIVNVSGQEFISNEVIEMQEVETRIVSDFVNIGELKYNEEVVMFNENNNIATVELENPLQKERIVSNGSWSGGSIPFDVSTLIVRCYCTRGTIRYKIDVRGSDSSILSAYSLAYSTPLWTVNSANLSIINGKATNTIPARATATIQAVLIEYGIVASSFGGYLTGELNTNGNYRVSYNF